MGGIVKHDALPSERGREAFAPVVTPNIVTEGPDGHLHGSGNIIASANADMWRPQDMAPRMRKIIWGK